MPRSKTAPETTENERPATAENERSATAENQRPATAENERPARTENERQTADRAERPAAGAGAAVVGARAAGGFFLLLSRLVRVAAVVVFALIVLAIILYDAKANPSNSIVKWIHDAGNTLTTPFHGLFTFHGLRKQLSVNWGIAAVVYLIAGGIVAAIIASPARVMPRFGARRSSRT
jgi:hypothetical protein